MGPGGWFGVPRKSRREPRVAVDLEATLVGRASHAARTVDLSVMGCLVRCEAAPDGGAVVDLRLELPDGPLRTKARVAERLARRRLAAGRAPALPGRARVLRPRRGGRAAAAPLRRDGDRDGERVRTRPLRDASARELRPLLGEECAHLAGGARLGLFRRARRGRGGHRARDAGRALDRRGPARARLLLLHGRRRAGDHRLDVRRPGPPRPRPGGGAGRRGRGGRAGGARQLAGRVPDAVLHVGLGRRALRAVGLRRAGAPLHAPRAARAAAGRGPAAARGRLPAAAAPRRAADGRRHRVPQPRRHRRRRAQPHLLDAGDLPVVRGHAGAALRLRALRPGSLAHRRRAEGTAGRADREPAGALERARVPGLGRARGAGPRARRGADGLRAARLPRAGAGERDARRSRSRTSGRTGCTSCSASARARTFAAHAWVRPPARSSCPRDRRRARPGSRARAAAADGSRWWCPARGPAGGRPPAGSARSWASCCPAPCSGSACLPCPTPTGATRRRRSARRRRTITRATSIRVAEALGRRAWSSGAWEERGSEIVLSLRLLDTQRGAR